jgi:hypothetical protein
MMKVGILFAYNLGEEKVIFLLVFWDGGSILLYTGKIIHAGPFKFYVCNILVL